MTRFVPVFAACLALAAPAAAQQGASLSELAASPVVTVRIGETVKSLPDEATITVTTQSRAPTAAAAIKANQANSEAMIAALRSAGFGGRDIQTRGVTLTSDFTYDNVDGRNSTRKIGYIASNTIQVKTRRIDRLPALMEVVGTAGAERISGPSFAIADPLPLRREARKRAMARGEAEATEYAVNAGFARAQLLSIDESLSYRSGEVVVMGSRTMVPGSPPPPPPPIAQGGGLEPGLIETGVTLTLVFRMVK